MSNFLRQSTASQSRAIGPFLDSTDFQTAKTGLTIANTDIKLVVNGGASANKNSGGGTHRVNGVYGITFDATDTATVGEIEVSVVVSGALPVFHKFWVLEEAAYDALFAASAPGYVANAPVNVAQFGGTNLTAASGIPEVKVASIANNAITAASINADAITDAKVAADVTIASVTGAVGSVTGNVGGNVTGSVGSVATGGITAGSIAADAIGASELAADAVAEIQSGLATAANLSTLAGYVDTEVASILAAVDTEIAAIKAKTDQLTFTVANQVDSNALSGGGGLDAAGVRAAVGLASANLDTQLTAIDDFLDTEIAAILADTNELQTDLVNGGRLDLLIDAIKAKTDNLPAAPAAAGDCLTAAGVRGAIGMSSANLDTQLGAIAGYLDTEVAAILAAVDTEIAAIKAKTDNLPAAPAATGDIPTAAQVADAVWDEDATAHQTQGTFGQAIGDPVADSDTLWGLVNARLDATVSSRASQASVDTIDDYVDTEMAAVLAAVDTEVAAIKAKTDNLPAAPAATGDIPSAAAIADQVWDEATSGHTTGGTFGAQAKTVVDAINAKTTNLPASPAATGDIPTAAVIADTVWDEDATAHQTQGTFGQAIGDPGADASTIWDLANTNLDGTISSRASQASVDDLPTNGEMASALSVIEGKVDTVDTVADAIKATTDNLPADPAGVSDLPDITTVEMYAEEIHRNSGLDALNPLTVTPTSREAGAIEIQITSDGGDGWIAERQ